MILDNKEVKVNLEVPADKTVIERCCVDEEGLERGERYLCIPEGIKEIKDGAFDEYNRGPVVANIVRMLENPQDELAEWSKKLSRRQLIKITFPPEAGTTVAERAGYMVEKEKRVRLLRLELPDSLQTVSGEALPDLLEEITVGLENQRYASLEGVLFSKDMKQLIRFPGYRGERPYKIPEGVRRIAKGAFAGACMSELTIPSTIEAIDPQSFRGASIGRLEIGEGTERIPTGAFEGCAVEELALPSTLRLIEDYAFKGICGLKRVTCKTEELAIGTGVFSEGSFAGIDWWAWSEIPKAAFLNCRLEKIEVPDGVEVIGDYAFAGCYTAKKVVLPPSVVSIGPKSFDEGDHFRSDIQMPESLYEFVYRLPALSSINGQQKSALWEQRKNGAFREDTDILESQKRAVERCLASMGFLMKRKMQKELDYLAGLIQCGAAGQPAGETV